MKNRTAVERKSERELLVTRTFNGPAPIVFEAWTKPELLKRWWAPKSFEISFLSCELTFENDVRNGVAGSLQAAFVTKRKESFVFHKSRSRVTRVDEIGRVGRKSSLFDTSHH